MGSSSNFGNMFSMAGAALFLPFLPMLPIQILLNNLLYDVSEIAIPFDRVDPEATARPVKWDVRLIERFMLVFGPVSSVFDFLTFYALLHLFGAGEALFQTGWFIEFDHHPGAGGFCHPHAAAILPEPAAPVPRRDGIWVSRRRGRSASSRSGPVVRFRRPATTVLRLFDRRDGCLPGARRNHQGLFLPPHSRRLIRAEDRPLVLSAAGALNIRFSRAVCGSTAIPAGALRWFSEKRV